MSCRMRRAAAPIQEISDYYVTPITVIGTLRTG